MTTPWLDSLRLAATDVPLVRRCYVEAMMLRAHVDHRLGRAFGGVEAALRAWRADPDGFATSRRIWCEARIQAGCYDRGALGPIAANRFLTQYAASGEAARTRQQFGAFPVADRVRMRYPKENDDPERQGDLIILKAASSSTGERGVLLVKYSEAFRRLAALFDLSSMAAEYQVVLEPSWWGYQDITFLFYLGADLDAVVLAQRSADFDFLAQLGSNLVPVRLGAGDWVDGETFRRLGETERDFDVVMVAGWSPMKRHSTLFRALRKVRRVHGRVLKAALIGYPQGWPRGRIEALMRKHDVVDQCVVFERIPHQEVARIVARSRVSVVLSRREGANKALYESLFCDTPVILLSDQRGVNLDHITDEVGLFTDEKHLGEALLDALDNPSRFRPRAWAQAHTGWQRSTETLNSLLKQLAGRRGLPWTVDIEAKKNAPNLRYAREGVYRRFDGAYSMLERHLLPV